MEGSKITQYDPRQNETKAQYTHRLCGLGHERGKLFYHRDVGKVVLAFGHSGLKDEGGIKGLAQPFGLRAQHMCAW